MRCFVLILALCFGDLVFADAVNNYVITRNVDSSLFDLKKADVKKAVRSVQLCSQLCMSETDCHIALYHTKRFLCYLFINQTSKSLTILNRSEYILIEDQCSHSHGNGQTTGFLHGCGDLNQVIYTDCQDVHDAGIRENGNFMLRPANVVDPVNAYCMFDENKGWTTLIRRMPRPGHYNFWRSWTEAIYGVGMLSTEYFLGLEYTYYFTHTNQKLFVLLEDWDGQVKSANYSQFYVEEADTKYTLRISGYSGNAGDSMSVHSANQQFTTWDSDNDKESSYNCAVRYTGMWWYKSCHHANLLGLWYEGGVYSKYATGMSWFTWRNHYYGYKYVHFMVGQ